jgi:hypothetical protein
MYVDAILRYVDFPIRQALNSDRENLMRAALNSHRESASDWNRFRKEAMSPPGAWTYWIFPYAGALIADAFRAVYSRLHRDTH